MFVTLLILVLLALAFIKLGALSVMVKVMGLLLSLGGCLIAALLSVIAWLTWKRRKSS